MSLNRFRAWLASAVCLVPLLWVTTAAAADDEKETASPKVEKAVEESKEAAGDAKESAQEAKDDAKQAADKAKDAAEDAKETAQEATDGKESDNGPKASVLVTNLDNPSGLAIHPQTGHVFIATHVAVYHFAPNEKDRSKRINYYITGWTTDEYGKGPVYKIGPLGLGFHGKHLIVGGGGRPDGQEVATVYEVNESEADHKDLEPIKETDAQFTLGPIKPGDLSARGEGNFYSVAVIGDSVFFSSNGDDTKGWVLRTQFQDGKFTELTPYIATKEQTATKLDGQGVDAPVPLAVSPDGKQLVVGQMGEVNVPNDSLLTTYNPETGKIDKLWKLEGVNDIAGLAYHPKTGELYGVDFSWVEPANGALYRLTIDGDTAKAEKIRSLDKPTALAFDKDGNLYITVYGTRQEGSDTEPGQLLRIKADDLPKGK